MPKCKLIEENVIKVKIKNSSLSGTVTLDSLPVSRSILIYKNKSTSDPFFLMSDEITGGWVLPVVGNHNDKFRVIVLGDNGENSIIFEDVIMT